MLGGALMYFIGYRGMSVDQVRTRLSQLLNLPGLAPPTAVANTSAIGKAGNAALGATP